MLVSKSDEWYVKFHEECIAAGLKEENTHDSGTSKRARLTKSGKGCDWEADHLEIYREASMQWPPDLTSDPDLAAATQHLPRRMQEVAYYQCHRQRDVCGKSTYHDLNMSLKYFSESAELVQTIVCSSTIFDRKNKKVLSGAELLMLQGYPPEDVLKYPSSNHQLTELAGNCFNGFAIGAIIIAMSSPAASRTHSTHPEPRAPAAQCMGNPTLNGQ